MNVDTRPVLALSGGVGGAKLALGLLHCLAPHALTIVANTGDDFEHLGLHISPDIDTLMYALSDRDDSQRGWGRRGETWNFMKALAELGGETWFQLGDLDLALHVERTRRLRAGDSLSKVTADIAERFQIPASIVPMSDQPIRTQLRTSEGWLDFQPWFVGCRAEPTVYEIKFSGARKAKMNCDVESLLNDDSLRAVVLCPSNPLISIDPILAVPGMRAALANCRAPVVAVSPLIGGEAVKGPTAKMMRDLGVIPGIGAISAHYHGLIDGLVVDEADRSHLEQLGSIATVVVPTLMSSLERRISVAQATMRLADSLARSKG